MIIIDSDSYYFAQANLLEQGVPPDEVRKMINDWMKKKPLQSNGIMKESI